jgi:nucleoside-diphosphate-sugar epimerase
MTEPQTFLVFGGTGRTGQHFIRLALTALKQGHRGRPLAHTTAKLHITDPNLQVVRGSITDATDLDALRYRTDFAICMLGGAKTQRDHMVNIELVRNLISAMRRQGVTPNS